MMKICIFGVRLFKPIADILEKEGHIINYNKISKDADLILNESHSHIYEKYKHLNLIKK